MCTEVGGTAGAFWHAAAACMLDRVYEWNSLTVGEGMRTEIYMDWLPGRLPDGLWHRFMGRVISRQGEQRKVMRKAKPEVCELV